MKLNPDCIRDILIAVEENTEVGIYFAYPSEIEKAPSLKKYSDNVIRYHMFQCAKSGLIDLRNDVTGCIDITDLTPKGHSLLADIRADNVWKKTKSVASKVGSYSLDALTKIATGVVTALINQQISGGA